MDEARVPRHLEANYASKHVFEERLAFSNGITERRHTRRSPARRHSHEKIQTTTAKISLPSKALAKAMGVAKIVKSTKIDLPPTPV